MRAEAASTPFRFYDPSAGAVTFDGTDLRAVSQASLLGIACGIWLETAGAGGRGAPSSKKGRRRRR